QPVAFTPVPVSLPPGVDVAQGGAHVPVAIRAPDLCGRFSGRVIRGVNARAKTPEWMVRRLERSGQRSLSALVDISNYVMLELGRPSHVFDLDKLHGGIDVRWGKAGEQLTLLNGTTIDIDAQVGVLADATGIESLAGIMGGASTAVSLDTTNIYVEAAFWWPDSIRGRARRYNFSTDAAHRFERGVDYATTVEHLERITRLLIDICGGEAGAIDDQIVNLPTREPVRMRVSRASRVIGVPIAAADVADVFTRLGLPFEQQDDVFLVTAPSYRFDIEIEEDLIEEVARIYGFEKIPARPPVAPSRMRGTDETRRSIHDIRHRIAARDYAETINFGFVDAAWETDFAQADEADGNAPPTPIKLLNPIASQLSVMRSSLIGSLVDVLRNNLNRRAERVRIFEVGRVFLRDASVAASEMTIAGIAQPVRLAALAYGTVAEEQWAETSRAVDYFDVKGDLEALFAPRAARFVGGTHAAFHPGRSARIEIDGKVVGWLGELHPRWQQKYELPRAPVLFEVDADALAEKGLPEPFAVSKFPPVRRDIAVVVARDVDAQSLLDALEETRREASCQIVQRIALFDEFRPDGERSGGLAATEKSLAFRISLQDTGGTLQENTVELAVQTLVDRLVRSYGARLR
ncbi:MAG: phenylalanine--tRNA ligase subunit beta, partial [Janthinobacterium lividum]